MSQTLLITGAAGFIGSNFVRYWRAHHPDDRIVALDALTYAGCLESLADVMPTIEFVHGDIREQSLIESLLGEHQVDTIVNFAAESHNSLAILEPGAFFSTNVIGTQSLLEAARRVEIGRFHHVSTCEVYGDMSLNRREWLHAQDHCRAIEAVLHQGRLGETYHVGSGIEADIETIADTILDHLGQPATLKVIVPDRPSHDRRYLLDSTRIRQELAWTPEIDFASGLQTTIDWYRDNEIWWSPLLDRAAVQEHAWRERTNPRQTHIKSGTSASGL